MAASGPAIGEYLSWHLRSTLCTLKITGATPKFWLCYCHLVGQGNVRIRKDDLRVIGVCKDFRITARWVPSAEYEGRNDQLKACFAYMRTIHKLQREANRFARELKTCGGECGRPVTIVTSVARTRTAVLETALAQLRRIETD